VLTAHAPALEAALLAAKMAELSEAEAEDLLDIRSLREQL
jgi:hypothetical protein